MKQSVPVSKMVIFGDSLSDNGNTGRISYYYGGERDPRGLDYNDGFRTYFSDLLSQVIARIGPYLFRFPRYPSSPYYQGFFSNGPTTIEYVAEYAGLDRKNRNQYQNLAFGASWSTTAVDVIWNSIVRFKPFDLRLLVQGKVLPPGLTKVVDLHIAEDAPFTPNTVFGIYFSGNDYINGFNDPVVVVSRQYNAIRRLIENGARHIFWGLVPDYTMAPCFQNDNNRQVIAKIGQQHNRYVRKMMKLLIKAWPDVHFTLGDIGKYFKDVAHNPENGFVVLNKPCINVHLPGCDRLPGSVSIFEVNKATVCDEPDKYLFWDQVHATGKVHRIVSGVVCHLLAEQGYQINCPSAELLRSGYPILD